MKLKFHFLWAFFAVFTIQAQVYNEAESIEFAQYMYSTFTVNPAATGVEGTFNFGINYRSELIKDFNHYKRESAALSFPLKNQRAAFGFSIINDEFDDLQYTYFDLAVAYILKLNQKADLAFGMKFRGNLLDNRFPETTFQPLQTFYDGIVERFVYNIGAGLLYSTDWFFAGVSVPSFLNTDRYDIEELRVDTRNLPVVFNTGYVFPLGNDFIFMPMFYSRTQSEEDTEIDISANLLFKDKFGINGVYRFEDSYGFFASFQTLDSVMVSFGYGKQTNARTEGTTTNDGIFQITLRYENVLKRGNKMFTRF